MCCKSYGLKRFFKMGFEIKSYIPRTHEMKNRILSKIKGACPSFFQKYNNWPNITQCLPEKYFLPNFGGGNCPIPPSPTLMAANTTTTTPIQTTTVTTPIKTTTQGSICRGGCGGLTSAGKTATPAGEHLQKCSRGRILTPTVNYSDKRSASR